MTLGTVEDHACGMLQCSHLEFGLYTTSLISPMLIFRKDSSLLFSTWSLHLIADPVSLGSTYITAQDKMSTPVQSTG